MTIAALARVCLWPSHVTMATPTIRRRKRPQEHDDVGTQRSEREENDLSSANVMPRLLLLSLFVATWLVLAVVYRPLQPVKPIEPDLSARKVPPIIKLWQGTSLFVKKVFRKKKKKKKSKVSLKQYPTAFTQKVKLSSEEHTSLKEFSEMVLQNIPDIHGRAPHVGWGSSQHWYDLHHRGGDVLDVLDGGHLLYSYFRIMKAKELSNVHFPFRLCKNGCNASVAIAHTLEWREKYQPHHAPPSVIRENEKGWVYFRGFARSPDNKNRHAMVWARVGIHKHQDPLAYFRCIFHSVDKAVAESLHHSHGRVGKVNAVVDVAHYEWGNLPPLPYIKQAVTMFQDHFPDRLGVVLLVNLSRTAEMLVNVIKALLTKDVREKIHVLAHDPEKRLEQLEALIEHEYIPKWLGGRDDFRFEASSYYPKRIRISEKEGRDFLTSMPYHAL